MSPLHLPSPTTTKILLSLLVAAPPTVSLVLYTYLRNSHSSAATWSGTTASRDHPASFAMSIANPRRLPVEQDSLVLRIPAKKLSSQLSDEEILARFERGFWGGWAFTPERWFFSITGIRLAKFKSVKQEPVVPELLQLQPSLSKKEIWSISGLLRTSTAPIGSLLFGNFLVLDSSTATESMREAFHSGSNSFPRPSGSFIEYAFGSDDSEFSGTHRFEVHRESESAVSNSLEGTAKTGEDHSKGEDAVVVTWSQVRCNPTKEGKFLPAWIVLFHEYYAKALFSDGVREVFRG